MRNFSVLLTAVLFTILFSGSLFASGYPSDYTDQRLRVGVDGPVALAMVSSGIMGPEFIIGYKKSGILNFGSSVNVLLRFVKEDENVFEARTTIGREWQGNGYLSTSLSIFALHENLYGFLRSGRLDRIEVAFYLNDVWDSKNGGNYVFKYSNLLSESAPNETCAQYFYNTVKSYSYPGVAEANWHFMVNILKGR